ncbi:hypothetical protein CHS0354_019004 [Potamilus streckersoni]|uniref:Major facilitator superfamily associated domain-containing protein n=1 Tax=Potamilus streckersoni TaxID=2493646 RepID=A0AAE0SQR5_9BIVA|nr:hypothetical protein CHS0354_019004 [Potamilus streckersoni]
MFLTIHYGSWMVCMFFTGVCNGVIWGFLYWHIENIGGTQLLIGLATTICHLSEVIMFFLVFIILKFLSPFTFMILGLLGFCVRFSIYATMSNPWLILPTEVSHLPEFGLFIQSTFVPVSHRNISELYRASCMVSTGD